ncbi:MAG TPA: hypothetical protein VK825_06335 [Xanthobacteraceae bacterium]|jgi:hypothetical protein|nr:hypothetical protein [Xanthobacteraceae bacterium]
MRPPIFGARPDGNTAQQYMHRARMFRAAAMRLVDYSNAEPNWPKYALVTHAIELALKAFALHCVEKGASPAEEPKQHDLVGWYLLAVKYGLPDDPDIEENIGLLNQLHLTHYTRYPQNKVAPNVDAIADSTVDHLIFTFTQVINPR